MEPYSNDWKPYNPSKPGLKRYGLSVTSLDGGLTGLPDLTSLSEYNRQNNTSYGEMSFKTLTKVYHDCSAIHPVIEPFLPYLGRSHFLKFDSGGYFPYHRDGYHYTEQVFRIFVPFSTSRDFFFFLGDQRIRFMEGRAYYFNACVEHALFSLAPNSLHLVLNVKLCEGSLRTLISSMASK